MTCMNEFRSRWLISVLEVTAKLMPVRDEYVLKIGFRQLHTKLQKNAKSGDMVISRHKPLVNKKTNNKP